MVFVQCHEHLFRPEVSCITLRKIGWPNDECDVDLTSVKSMDVLACFAFDESDVNSPIS